MTTDPEQAPDPKLKKSRVAPTFACSMSLQNRKLPLLRWLSHLREVHLETVLREADSSLHVSLKKGRLMLHTDQTIYSWEDRYMNFVWGMERIDYDRLPGDRALLLGMGLAAIPFIAERKLHWYADWTAVELDRDIIRLAKRYAFPRLRRPPVAICDDAAAWIQASAGSFDLVILDVCREDVIDPVFESAAFLQAVHRNLNPGGLFLYNRFYSSYRDQFKTDRFFRSTFTSVFPEAVLIDQGGTCLLASRPDVLKPS